MAILRDTILLLGMACVSAAVVETDFADGSCVTSTCNSTDESSLLAIHNRQEPAGEVDCRGHRALGSLALDSVRNGFEVGALILNDDCSVEGKMKFCKTRFAEGEQPQLPDVQRLCSGQYFSIGSLTSKPYVFDGIDLPAIFPGVVHSKSRVHECFVLHGGGMRSKSFNYNAKLRFSSSAQRNLVFEGDFRGKTVHVTTTNPSPKIDIMGYRDPKTDVEYAATVMKMTCNGDECTFDVVGES